MDSPFRDNCGCLYPLFMHFAPLLMLVILLQPYIEQVNAEAFFLLAVVIFFAMYFLPYVLYDCAIMFGYIAGAVPLVFSSHAWTPLAIGAPVVFLVYFIRYCIPDLVNKEVLKKLSRKNIMLFSVLCALFVGLSTVSMLVVLKPDVGYAQSNSQTYKVAGVTFDNDNGTSRQRILSDLMDVYGEWDEIPCRLVEYDYYGDPAFYVYVGTKIIGNIPADAVAEVKSLLPEIEDTYVRISEFAPDGETIYYARVTIDY